MLCETMYRSQVGLLIYAFDISWLALLIYGMNDSSAKNETSELVNLLNFQVIHFHAVTK